MKLSIIVPCYNEEAVITETYKRLIATAVPQQDFEYEIIFINDGSKDKTLSLLTEFAKENSSVKIINFSRNFGHQCAVTAGLNNCTGDVAAIIDADLQDPPQIIPAMIETMKRENANVVFGVRNKRDGESWFKLFTAKCFYRILNKMSEVNFPLDTGDFRLIDRKIIEQFNGLKESHKYIRGLISWMGFKQVPFYYDREKRFAGETHYPLKKMLKLATTGILYFSKKPLQIATGTGFLALLIGILYALLVLILHIFTNITFVSGWMTIIFLIIFFGGVQLLTIGILGTYLGNLFEEIKGRPEYIIESKVNFDK